MLWIFGQKILIDYDPERLNNFFYFFLNNKCNCVSIKMCIHEDAMSSVLIIEFGFVEAMVTA